MLRAALEHINLLQGKHYKSKSSSPLMEIDLGFPALALVTTQDTAGILRQASGTLVSATKATLISQGRAQYCVLQME